MAWFKRNLFFAIGGIISLLLLIAAGVYYWRSYSHNSAAFSQLSETVQTLRDLASQRPSPGNSKIDNTATAREQEQELREWIKQAEANFQPIATIPEGEVSSRTFAAALREVVNQLQHEADAAKVKLPPQY